MEQNVAIGVPAQALFVSDFHSSDFEWNAAFEFMRVPAVADFHAESLATDLHGFSRIFFLSLSKSSLRN